MVKVFVSYRHADTFAAAHAIGYALRCRGHEAFVDTWNIGEGENIFSVISAAIAQSNCTIALMGPSFQLDKLSERTDAVAFEWRKSRFHGIPIVPVLVFEATMPARSSFPEDLQFVKDRLAFHLRKPTFSEDMIRLVDNVDLISGEPRRAARVLWVDDEPRNNENERKELRQHGIVFDNVVSSNEALDQLAFEHYDLIISDICRSLSSDGDDNAGETLLLTLRTSGRRTPVVFYTSLTKAESKRENLMSLGAVEVTAYRAVLSDTVLKSLGRTDPSGASTSSSTAAGSAAGAGEQQE